MRPFIVCARLPKTPNARRGSVITATDRTPASIDADLEEACAEQIAVSVISQFDCNCWLQFI